MKVVFITNFYNHHQKYLAEALYERTNHNYCFIETEPISKERLQMGWGTEAIPPYVMKSYTDSDSLVACQKIIDEADVVIYGSAPYHMIENRLKNGKLTFCYSERIYRKGCELHKWPVRLLRHFKMFGRYPNLHMLCASAYTAADYAKTGTFLRKTYKWGYFTEVNQYENIEQFIASKKENSILWVARFIPLKHPEAALYVAKRLKKEGYRFTLNLIGGGELVSDIEAQIKENDLSDCVHLLGTMKPHEVRAHMEQSEIFLFTSDKNEGWGAVLNESMNSGCAIVANHAIGSVPFLVQDGENGLIYKDGDLNDLYEKVKRLLDAKEERIRVAKNAYHTMANEWNAENAAQQFLSLCQRLLAGEKKVCLRENGVCSPAEIIKDNWYRS